MWLRGRHECSLRKLVATHKLRYLAALKAENPTIAMDVMREWRAMDPPGRFLAKTTDVGGGRGGDGGNNNRLSGNVSALWHNVGNKTAREKASKCLHEHNGVANKAIVALVKTVTTNSNACPVDYATLMKKAVVKNKL
jgi:hypothetical protein